MARLRWVGVLLFLAACGSRGSAVLTQGAAGRGVAAPVPTTAAPIAGVSGGDPNAAACQLLSVDDVARTVGNAVRAPTGEGKFCFWGTLVDKGTSADLTVTRTAAARAGADCAVQRNSLDKEAKQEPVSGIGSSAVWAWQQVATLVQATLIGCFPDAVVVVRLSGERDQAALRAEATSLVQAVRSRL